MAYLAPLVTEVIDDYGPITGRVDNYLGGNPLGFKSTFTDDNTPLIKGTSEPGTTVDIYDTGSFLGTAIAGADWAWQFQVTTPQVSGLHDYTVTIDGFSKASAIGAYSTRLDHVLAPVITNVSDAAGGSVGDGAGPFTAP